jgi:hypothetical protein
MWGNQTIHLLLINAYVAVFGHLGLHKMDIQKLKSSARRILKPK